MITGKCTWKVLHWLFRYPLARKGVREIARATKVSIATASRELRYLYKKKLLLKEDGKYIANRGSLEFCALKQAYNIYNIKTSPLLQQLVERYKPQAIVLFGSYAHGEDHERSDVDLAIINPNSTEIFQTSPYESIFFRKVSLHLLKWRNTSEELRESVMNGVTLSGLLDDRPI